MKEISSFSGISISLLSEIETGKKVPSIKTLMRIADALKVNPSLLLDHREPKYLDVTLKAERPEFISRELRVVYKMVTRGITDGKLMVLSLELPPGMCRDRMYSHEGEECLLVQKGEIKVQVGDESYFLKEGDSICFKSTVPHNMFNVGDITAEIVCINTPPSAM
jgi:quercetin dioxygenase-like cupin family protein